MSNHIDTQKAGYLRGAKMNNLSIFTDLFCVDKNIRHKKEPERKTKFT
ncbi:hypothetical protein [Brunnivagina elsteri]|nr:hypothetical protein [Calothrix elsteri]